MKARQTHNSARAGFTLVELMVVIIVLLVVMTLTLVLLNQTTKDDKIAAASRQVQSMLEGARDRALHARDARGVRFLHDPNDSDLIVSMVYIGSPGKFSEGFVNINSTDRRTITLNGTNWSNLVSRDLLDGTGGVARIRINDNPTFYTVRYNTTAGNWQLTKDFLDAATLGTNLRYQLDLLPAILPNQEPRELPDGVVIDFDHSVTPNRWSTNINQRDILFSPRGTVIGNAASIGHIHLLITGLGDATGTPHKDAGDDTKENAETVVSITTQSGSVSTHSVYSTTDPFRLAETGVETK